MSRTPHDVSGPAMRDDRVLMVLAGVVLALAAWLALPADSGRPLDPRSTGPSGLAAGVAMLEELGSTVTIGAEVTADAATVLVTRIDLVDDQVAQLRDHLEVGGRVVLFDPTSPLAGTEVIDQLVTDQFGPTTAQGDCDLLDGYVREVASSSWLVMDPDVEGQACLSVGPGVGLVVQAVGSGTVAVLGAPQVVTNDLIDERDHARLLVLLAAPDVGTPVLVLDDRPLAFQEQAGSVLDLVTARFWAPFGIVLAAIVLLGLSRARRLGPPVQEALPVRVPGSELGLAIGELMQRHGHRDTAAARLRADLRRELTRALELPADTEAATVRDALARRRPDLAPEDVDMVLADGPVGDDEGLTRVAAAAARLRTALHVGDRR